MGWCVVYVCVDFLVKVHLTFRLSGSNFGILRFFYCTPLIQVLTHIPFWTSWHDVSRRQIVLICSFLTFPLSVLPSFVSVVFKLRASQVYVLYISWRYFCWAIFYSVFFFSFTPFSELTCDVFSPIDLLVILCFSTS